MLIGQYEGRLNSKHQVVFPKRYREVLGEKLILTKGLEDNLLIVSEENWKTLLEGTEGQPFTNKSAREVQRFLLGNASVIELDSQGRFVIPEYLRVYSNIETDVVFVGVQRFVEVWDKKRWDEEQQKLSTVIEKVADKLTHQERNE